MENQGQNLQVSQNLNPDEQNEYKSLNKNKNDEIDDYDGGTDNESIPSLTQARSILGDSFSTIGSTTFSRESSAVDNKESEKRIFNKMPPLYSNNYDENGVDSPAKRKHWCINLDDEDAQLSELNDTDERDNNLKEARLSNNSYEEVNLTLMTDYRQTASRKAVQLNKPCILKVWTSRDIFFGTLSIKNTEVWINRRIVTSTEAVPKPIEIPTLHLNYHPLAYINFINKSGQTVKLEFSLEKPVTNHTLGWKYIQDNASQQLQFCANLLYVNLYNAESEACWINRPIVLSSNKILDLIIDTHHM